MLRRGLTAPQTTECLGGGLLHPKLQTKETKVTQTPRKLSQSQRVEGQKWLKICTSSKVVDDFLKSQFDSSHK